MLVNDLCDRDDEIHLCSTPNHRGQEPHNDMTKSVIAFRDLITMCHRCTSSMSARKCTLDADKAVAVVAFIDGRTAPGLAGQFQESVVSFFRVERMSATSNTRIRAAGQARPHVAAPQTFAYFRSPRDLLTDKR